MKIFLFVAILKTVKLSTGQKNPKQNPQQKQSVGNSSNRRVRARSGWFLVGSKLGRDLL